MTTRSESGKINVFISYSRDDIAFADQLIAALALSGCATTIDRQGIFGGEDWKRRLGNLIRDADTIVIVLSPSSARSPICAWEADEAVRQGKRIIPILCRPLDDVLPPQPLSDLNYIYFYADPRVPGSGFGTGQVRLVAALDTDLEWLREHTRLLQLATEWQVARKPASRLLFGDGVSEALQWIAKRPRNAPEPTPLHFEFIRASEEQEARRLAAEARHRKEIEELDAARLAALRERERDQQVAAERTRRLGMLMTGALASALLFAALAGSFGYLVLQKKREIEVQRLLVLKQQTGSGAEAATLPEDNGKVGGGDGPGQIEIRWSKTVLPNHLEATKATASAK